MIVILDDEINNLDLHNEDILYVLSEVLNSHIRCDHLVMASKKTCLILDGADIGIPAKRALKAISRNTTFDFNFEMEKVCVYLKITNNTEKKQGKEICIPIRKLFKKQLCKSSVLAEDSRDAYLFQMAGKHYMINNKIKGVDVKLEIKHGGGEETPTVLEALVVNDSSPVVCITDSDFFYEGASKSKKSKKCDEIVSKSKANLPMKHFILSVREIENLVPIEIMHDLGVPSANVIGLERFFSMDPVAYRYIDLKKGVMGCWINSGINDNKFKLFWTGRIKKIFGKDISDITKCSKDCDSKCVIIKGAKLKLIESLIDFMNLNSNQKSSELMIKGWQGEMWLDIGRLCFSWGIVAKQI